MRVRVRVRIKVRLVKDMNKDKNEDKDEDKDRSTLGLVRDLNKLVSNHVSRVKRQRILH